MDSPVIQLRLKGRVLQTVSFEGETLRIGRMKQNDIVISNASVSRFHALLRREEGRVILEDSGSENGCYVNGTRVTDPIELRPGDEVMIGKHELVLSEAGSEEEVSSEAPKEEKNDAWDASMTYLVGVDTQAKMLEGAGSAPAEPAETEAEEELPVAADAEAVAAESPPEEIDPAPDAVVAESASTPIENAEPEPIGDAEQEIDFGEYDVEVLDDEPEEDCEQVVEIAEPVTDEVQSPEEPTWHAGLIIQHQGKLDRIISWDQDRLVAGRSRGCEIFLDQAEISRRHAVFFKEEGRYEVRDLDSVNGVLVNGEKIQSRGLELGDVVKIEDFEITFLLDRQPIESEIKTDRGAAPVDAEASSGPQVTKIDESLLVGPVSSDPVAGQEPPPPAEEEVAEASEGSLFEPEEEAEDEDKELADVEVISPEPIQDEDPGAPLSTDEVLTLEVKLRVEDLPPQLRAALAAVDPGELRLPVEIVLKTDD
jgi:pSer/pThr/pTyr-binding forkhead associated (FHA) protein